jgi:hypothetical protein
MSTGALSSGWVLLNLTGVSALAACARDAARTGEPFRTLTEHEGQTMRAFAARIVPTDETLPGAEEAGAAWFIDRSLADWFPEMVEPVRSGMVELDAASAVHGGTFIELNTDDQDAVIRDIETTPFFALGRTLTILGVLSHPKYGGGRNGVPEQLLGITHQPSWTPPFGEYDAEQAGTGGVS